MQGASEVLYALGDEKLHSVVSQLLPLANHPKPAPREGLLWLLAFLPSTMGEGFANLIDVALPVVLKVGDCVWDVPSVCFVHMTSVSLQGLADDIELVRGVAMRSGQAIVNQHAASHSQVLIPPLQEGLFDESWRIRQSSVELLGTLMYRIAGVRAITTADTEAEAEDAVDTFVPGTTRECFAITLLCLSHAALAPSPLCVFAVDTIAQVIGAPARDDVLAMVYMLRCDLVSSVRQSSLQVWKSIVPNTGRALREMLPALMTNVIAALCSDDPDNVTVAGRCLGDIVKKLGERVLPSVVPTLREGLKSSDPEKRQGVCLGLSEVIGASTKRQLEDFLDILIQAVQVKTP